MTSPTPGRLRSPQHSGRVLALAPGLAIVTVFTLLDLSAQSTTAVVGFVSGLGTWLIAPANTVHLGASGLVFGYATYLVARGILSRRLVDLAVGAVVAVIWGITLLQGLLPQDHISWQAHLFGAIGGVCAASILAGRRPEPEAAAPAL